MRGTKHILSPLDQILDFTEGESFKKSCSTIQQFGICESQDGKKYVVFSDAVGVFNFILMGLIIQANVKTPDN